MNTSHETVLPEFIPAGGSVVFPETADEERKKATAYFLAHPIAVVHAITYGDEDRSISDYPDGNAPTVKR